MSKVHCIKIAVIAAVWCSQTGISEDCKIELWRW